MANQKVIVYVLCAFLVANAIVYFLAALGEYTDLTELLSYGIDGETQDNGATQKSWFTRRKQCSTLSWPFHAATISASDSVAALPPATHRDTPSRAVSCCSCAWSRL